MRQLVQTNTLIASPTGDVTLMVIIRTAVDTFHSEELNRNFNFYTLRDHLLRQGVWSELQIETKIAGLGIGESTLKPYPIYVSAHVG